MKNLKELQQQEQRICLEEFLERVTSLGKFLDSSYKLTRETRENIERYCDYKVHIYYQRYLNYLKEYKEKKSSV